MREFLADVAAVYFGSPDNSNSNVTTSALKRLKALWGLT